MGERDIKPSTAAKKDVLIIGGGISGITVALELVRLGIDATIVEREATLGGMAASFCCKASETCNKCFACVADKSVREVKEHASISILTQTELVDLTGVPGDFHAVLDNNGGTGTLDFSALVFAAGIDPYDAAIKGEYGYGSIQNVLTAGDLEAMLRNGSGLSRPSDGMVPSKIAFFQCVGSRDQAAGNLYCSQVCCAYALRLIRAIRYKHPDVDIAFFYMDIQPAGAHFAEFLGKCRQDANIRFVRSIPSKVYNVSKTEALRVRSADPLRGEVTEEDFDLVVLSVGMVLKKEAADAAERLGLSRNDDGFLAVPEASGGVFVTGACTGPKDIDRCITQAKSLALKVYDYLQGRS